MTKRHRPPRFGLPKPQRARISPDTPGAITPRPRLDMGGSVRPQQTFRPAKAPNAVPAQFDMANDEAFLAVSEWATGGQWFSEGLGFLGYPYLAELTQRAEYRRGVEIIAQEMTRKWIEVTSTSDDDESDAEIEAKADKVKKMDEALTKFQVRDVFRKAIEIDGFFGRSHIYIDTDEGDKPDILASRLVLSDRTVRKGKLKGFKVVEPIWTYPNAYNSNDPTKADFYVPQNWFVQGKLIHRTRLLTIVGREMPDLLKPAYSFGGLALTQMAKPYVDNWLRSRQSGSDLLHSFSKTILKTDMSVILGGGGADELLTRLDVFNRTRDNRGVAAIDMVAEDVVDVSTPLSGVADMVAQAQEQMSSVWGIPLVIFLGVTPSGLNASSDGEVRSFYAWCKSQQENTLRDTLQFVFDLIQLDTFGTIDPGLGFTFLDLWEQDEGELATNRKTEADTDGAYLDRNVLDAEDVRRRLSKDKDSPYHGIAAGDVPDVPEEDGEGNIQDGGQSSKPKAAPDGSAGSKY